jgi:hypothetical protein
MTSRPITFGTNASINTPGSTLTPDLVEDVKLTHVVAGTAGTATSFDTTGCIPVTASCFLQNPPATGPNVRFGNLGRNNFFGPGLGDLSLFRKFDFAERVKLEFRAEATNFTNSPAFGIEYDARRRNFGGLRRRWSV